MNIDVPTPSCHFITALCGISEKSTYPPNLLFFSGTQTGPSDQSKPPQRTSILAPFEISSSSAESNRSTRPMCAKLVVFCAVTVPCRQTSSNTVKICFIFKCSEISSFSIGAGSKSSFSHAISLGQMLGGGVFGGIEVLPVTLLENRRVQSPHGKNRQSNDR